MTYHAHTYVTDHFHIILHSYHTISYPHHTHHPQIIVHLMHIDSCHFDIISNLCHTISRLYCVISHLYHDARHLCKVHISSHKATTVFCLSPSTHRRTQKGITVQGSSKKMQFLFSWRFETGLLEHT